VAGELVTERVGAAEIFVLQDAVPEELATVRMYVVLAVGETLCEPLVATEPSP
jgi:hypothetical protein